MKKIHKYLLLTILFLLQAYLIRFHIGLYPTNLQEILIIVLTGTFLFSGTFNPKNLLKHRVITVFVALTLLSILTAKVENNLDLIRHLKFLISALAISFIFIETFKTKQQQENAIEIAGLGAVTFGIFSVIYNLAGINIANDLRLLGPLDAAVYLAYYMAPFLIFFAIKYIQAKKRRHLIYVITLAILIIATRSMGAVGGSFLVITIYILKEHSNIFSSKKTKIALLIAIIALSSAIFYTKILPTIQTKYSSLDERGEIWKTSIALLKEPEHLIVGTGFGQFQANYETNVKQVLGHEPLDYYVLQPHNIFFLFIFNYGILGLLFILLLMKKTLWNLNTIPAFIMLYFFIHGMIDTPIFKNDILILFILFAQLTISKQKLNPSKQSKDH